MNLLEEINKYRKENEEKYKKMSSETIEWITLIIAFIVFTVCAFGTYVLTTIYG